MAGTRKLAAIMAVDVVGYSRLMGEDEAGTAVAVREHREAARPLVVEKGGRIVKTMGDGLLLEFPSVVAAVECAVAIQKLMAERNADVPEDKRIVYRVGVNLGDVLIEGDDILGEGVNIAARLEGICEPGGVMISGSAHDHVRGRIDAEFGTIIRLGCSILSNRCSNGGLRGGLFQAFRKIHGGDLKFQFVSDEYNGLIVDRREILAREFLALLRVLPTPKGITRAAAYGWGFTGNSMQTTASLKATLSLCPCARFNANMSSDECPIRMLARGRRRPSNQRTKRSRRLSVPLRKGLSPVRAETGIPLAGSKGFGKPSASSPACRFVQYGAPEFPSFSLTVIQLTGTGA
jgi:hypothetical protein